MDFKKEFGMKIEKVLLPESKVSAAQTLYPGQGRGEVRKRLKSELSKRLIITVALAILILLGAIFKGASEKPKTLDFTRNPLNQGAGTVGLTLTIGDNIIQYDLMVGSEELTDTEIDILHSQVEAALDKYILSENTDFYHVTTSLLLPTKVTFEGACLYLTWSSDRVDIVDNKGTIKNSDMDKNTTVTLKAKVRYGQEFRVYERLLTVLPKTLSEEEKQLQEALETINDIEGNRSENKFTLPEKIGNVQISLTESSVNYVAAGLIFAIIILLAGYYSFFEEVNKRRKIRIQQGKEDYKDFIRKLTLLLSAGMSVRLAWKKLCTDYAKKAGNSLLSEALAVSLREMDSGIQEQVCYQRFGERMGSRSFERLAEILSQQSQKGVIHVSQVLEKELRDVCEAEKEQIRIKAEKTSTMLLFPIVGLLTIVFLVIMVPAFAGMAL